MESIWDHIRVFFKDSEVVFWGRLQALGGLIVIAGAAMDWSPLLATGLSVKQIGITGGILLVQGIVTELARRAREPHDLGVEKVADLSTQMIPATKADTITRNPTTGALTITPPSPALMTPVFANVATKAAGE